MVPAWRICTLVLVICAVVVSAETSLRDEVDCPGDSCQQGVKTPEVAITVVPRGHPVGAQFVHPNGTHYSQPPAQQVTHEAVKNASHSDPSQEAHHSAGGTPRPASSSGSSSSSSSHNSPTPRSTPSPQDKLALTMERTIKLHRLRQEVLTKAQQKRGLDLKFKEEESVKTDRAARRRFQAEAAKKENARKKKILSLEKNTKISEEKLKDRQLIKQQRRADKAARRRAERRRKRRRLRRHEREKERKSDQLHYRQDLKTQLAEHRSKESARKLQDRKMQLKAAAVKEGRAKANKVREAQTKASVGIEKHTKVMHEKEHKANAKSEVAVKHEQAQESKAKASMSKGHREQSKKKLQKEIMERQEKDKLAQAELKKKLAEQAFKAKLVQQNLAKSLLAKERRKKERYKKTVAGKANQERVKKAALSQVKHERVTKEKLKKNGKMESGTKGEKTAKAAYASTQENSKKSKSKENQWKNQKMIQTLQTEKGTKSEKSQKLTGGALQEIRRKKVQANLRLKEQTMKNSAWFKKKKEKSHKEARGKREKRIKLYYRQEKSKKHSHNVDVRAQEKSKKDAKRLKLASVQAEVAKKKTSERHKKYLVHQHRLQVKEKAKKKERHDRWLFRAKNENKLKEKNRKRVRKAAHTRVRNEKHKKERAKKAKARAKEAQLKGVRKETAYKSKVKAAKKERAHKKEQKAKAAHRKKHLEYIKATKAVHVRKWNFRAKPGHIIASPGKIRNFKHYTYTFWVRPEGIRKHKAELLHKGFLKNTRDPAFYFLPSSTKLSVMSGFYKRPDFHIWTGKLPLWKWSYISFQHQAGLVKLFVNGNLHMQIKKNTILAPRMNGGPLYACSTAYKAALATMSDLVYWPIVVPYNKLLATMKAHHYKKFKKTAVILKRPNWKPSKGLRIAKNSQIKASGQFSYMFWIMPNAYHDTWTNVLHKGANNMQRSPSVFLYPKSSRLHIRSSDLNSWDNGLDPKAPLKLYKWTHVVFVHRQGMFKVYYNNVEVASGSRAMPVENRGNMYSGSRYYKSADATLADLRYVNGIADVDEIQWAFKQRHFKHVESKAVVVQQFNHAPKKGKVLAKSSKLQKNGRWTYMFWLRPEGTRTKDSVILQKGSPITKDQGPAFMLKAKTSTLRIRSATTKNPNYGFDLPTPLTLHKWVHVSVHHSHAELAVYLDGKVAKRVKHTAGPAFNSGDLYSAPEWTVPAYATISDVRYYPRAATKLELYNAVLHKHYLKKKAYMQTLRRYNFQPRKAYKIASSELKESSHGEYSYMFWIRPYYITHRWANILYKGDKRRTRDPAIFLKPGTTRLVINQSDRKNWNGVVSPTKALPLYKWTHVAISRRAGRVRVWFNGDLVVNKYAMRPIMNKGVLYSSDLWHHKAYVHLSDVRYYSGFLTQKKVNALVRLKRYKKIKAQELLVMTKPFRVAKGKRIAFSSQMKSFGQFGFLFWIKPEGVKKDWASILHKGPQTKLAKHESPAVLFSPNSLKIAARSADSQGKRNELITKAIAEYQWTHVAVTHKSGQFQVYLNGVLEVTKAVTGPLMNRAHLRAGNKAYEPALAKLADIRYFSVVPSERQIGKAVRQKHYKADAKVTYRVVTKTFQPTEGHIVATDRQIRTNRAYSYMFWIHPFYTVAKKWTSVMHKGTETTEQGPAFKFYPGSTRLAIRVSTAGNMDNKLDPGASLPLYKWTHVALSVRGGLWQVWYNRKLVFKLEGKTAHMPTENKGPVYAGSPWLSPAHCDLADIRHVSGPLTTNDIDAAYNAKAFSKRVPPVVVLKPSNFQPEKGRRIAKNSHIKKRGAYTYMFWVRPEGTSEVWSNLFMKGSMTKQQGPAVFMVPNKAQLRVRSSVLGNWKYSVTPSQKLPMWKWTHVSIEHKAGSLRVFYNDQMVASVSASRPEMNWGDLYASHRLWPAASVTMSDLRMYPYVVSPEAREKVFKKKSFTKHKVTTTKFHPSTARVARGKTIALAKFMTESGQASFMFWMRPNEISAYWTNVMHHGRTATSYQPSIWMIPKTNKLRVYSATLNNARGTYIDGEYPLEMYKWTHVAVSHRGGMLKLWLNGLKAAVKKVNSPYQMPGTLYMSSPWAKPAKAHFSDVRYVDGFLHFLTISAAMGNTKPKQIGGGMIRLHKGNFQPIKGRVISASSQLNKGWDGQYSISFWIKNTGFKKKWTGVLFKGTHHAERGPGIFFWPNSARLHIRSATWKEPNHGCDPKHHLVQHKWTHVTITHKESMMAVYFDGRLEKRQTWAHGPKRNLGLMYSSDKWHSPAWAVLSDLRWFRKALSPSQVLNLSRGVSYKKKKLIVTRLKSHTFRLKKGKLLARNSQLANDGQFSYTMWIHPFYQSHHWSSILHKGPVHKQQSPAIYMYPKSTRLHFRSSTARHWNDGFDPVPQLKLYAWTHVAVGHRAGTLKVWYNGLVVLKKYLGRPKENNGHLYGCARHSHPAYAYLADVRHVNQLASTALVLKIMNQKKYSTISNGDMVLVKAKNFALRKQHVVSAWLLNRGQYSMMFWLRPHGTTKGWGQILHKGYKDTERTPSIFFHPQSNKMMIVSGVWGNWNKAVSLKTPIPFQKWTHVAISHQKGEFRVYLNGKMVVNSKWGLPLMNKGPLYAGSKYYMPVPATMSDLRYFPFAIKARTVSKYFKKKLFKKRVKATYVIKKWNLRVKKGLRIATAGQIRKGLSQHSYMFWINIFGVHSTWSNVLHHGASSTSRTPSVFVFPHNSRLRIQSGTWKKWDEKVEPTQKIPMYQWTHVAVTHRAGLLRVWYNGKVVATKTKVQRPLETNGNVYASNPWHVAAHAFLSDIRHISGTIDTTEVAKRVKAKRFKKIGTSSKIIMGKNFRPQRSKVLASSSQLIHSGRFTYMLWIRPEGTVHGKWGSVFFKGKWPHERNPAVFFYPGSARLHIRSGISGMWDFGLDPKPSLPMWTWTHVAISHEMGSIQVHYNAQLVGSIKSSKLPGPSSNKGPLYGSSPFGPAAPCTISDFRYYAKVVTPKKIQKERDEDRFQRTSYKKFLIRSGGTIAPARNMVYIRKPYALPGVYSYLLWIRPFYVNPHWSNIFARGLYPALYFIGGSTRLHFQWNHATGTAHTNLPVLPLYRWSHVAITHSSGRLVVWINGRKIYSSAQTQPRHYNKEPLMVRRNYNAAMVELSDFRYIAGPISKKEVKRRTKAKAYKSHHAKPVTIKKWNYRPKKNQVLSKRGAVPFTGQYTWTFWLKLDGHQRWWSTLFRQGNNHYWQNIHVYMAPWSNRLTFRSSTARKWHLTISPGTGIAAHKWTHVAFSHKHRFIGIYYNNVKVWSSRSYDGPVAYRNQRMRGPTNYRVPFAIISDLKVFPTVLSRKGLSKVMNMKRYKKTPIATTRLVKGTWHGKRSKIFGTNKRLSTQGSYSIQFWVKPYTHIDNQWATLFERRYCKPCIRMYPHYDNTMYIWQRWEYGGYSGHSVAVLPAYKWTAVTVRARYGRMEVWFNGRRMLGYSRRERPRDSGYFWHPHNYPVVGAYLSDFRFYNGYISPGHMAAYKKQALHRKKFGKRVTLSAKTFRGYKGMRLARGKQFHWNGAYSLMFWLKPEGRTPYWSNVLHKGLSYYHRRPSVFFYPHSTRLALFFSTVASWHAQSTSGVNVPLGKWTHVVITLKRTTCQIFQMGKRVHKQSIGTGTRYWPLWDRGHFYTSSPWDRPAFFKMADVRFYGKVVSKKIMDKARRQKNYKKEKKIVMTLRKYNYRPRNNRVIAQANKIKKNRQFSYLFWIYPYEYNSGWSNLIFKGSYGTQRNPAVWRYPNSNRLHIRSGTMDSWNSGCDPGRHLTMYKWTHVAFTHTAGSMKVYYDGKEVASCGVKFPLENNSPLYSSRYGHVARVIMSDLRHVNDAISQGEVKAIMKKKVYKSVRGKMKQLIKFNTIPRQGRVIAGRYSLPPWTGRYTFMFWVRHEGRSGGWTNLFFHGAHGNQQVPAFWIHPHGYLHGVSGTKSNWANQPFSWHRSDNRLKLNEWTHFALSHKAGAQKWYINGELIQTRYIRDAPAWNGNVPIWMSNPWHRTTQATVSDVRWYPYVVGDGAVEKAHKKKQYRADKVYKLLIKKGTFRIKQNNLVAYNHKFKNTGQYHFSFWIRPWYISHTWTNILHKGNHDTHRNPALWFYPGSTRVHLRSSTAVSWNDGWDHSEHLPLYKWTHYSFAHRAGSLKIWYNGRLVSRRWKRRPSWYNGHLYTSNPWYTPAYAQMSDLRYWSRMSPTKEVKKLVKKNLHSIVREPMKVLVAKNFKPVRGRVIATASQIQNSGRFTYMFWIKPLSRKNYWQSILHKGYHNTQRNPAIWFIPWTTRLHVRSGVYGSWNFGTDPGRSLALAKWTHVVIQHTSKRLNVYFNTIRVSTASSSYPPQMNSGHLYAGDRFHHKAEAILSDLRYFPYVASFTQMKKYFKKRLFTKEKITTTVLKKWNFQPRKGYVAAYNRQLRFTYAYTYQFWIRPYGIQPGWASIMHKGGNNYQRSPAIWFYPWSTRLHIRSGVFNSWNAGYDPSQSLAVYKWTHVAVSHKEGSMQVHYNGKRVTDVGVYAPMPNGGNLMAGDPWHHQPYCTISDLRYSDGFLTTEQINKVMSARRYRNIKPKTVILSKLNIKPKRGRVLRTASQLKRTGMYTYSFWLRPEGTQGGWSNILHKGQSDAWWRNPAIWFYPGSSRLHIRSGVHGSWNYGLDPGYHLAHWQWTHVTVQHSVRHMRVLYNGHLQARHSGYGRGPLLNTGPLYFSNPWYHSAHATLSDFRFDARMLSDAEIQKHVKARRMQSFSHMTKILVPKNKMIRRGQIVGRHKQIKHAGQYTYMFWIRPHYIHGSWGNIIHKGSRDSQRQPAIWFYPGSTRLHIRIGDRASWNHGGDPGQHLKMYEWNHVAITAREGKQYTWYNGVMVMNRHTYRPFENTAPLYMSNPWYHPAYARISDLRYIPGFVNGEDVRKVMKKRKYQSLKFKATVMMASNYKPVRGKIIAKANMVRPSGQYTWSFWLKPHATAGYWTNILHHGNRDNQRNPAVWQYPGSTRLHIRSGSRHGWNWGSDPGAHLPSNKWTHVAIIHKHHFYTVLYNGQVQYTNTGALAPYYYNAPVYSGNPWYHPFKGEMSDVRYYPQGVTLDVVRKAFRAKKYREAALFTHTIKSGNFIPKRGHRAATDNQIRKAHKYTYIFWVYPTVVKNGWANILHKGNKDSNRNPAIWFYPHQTRLHIRSGDRSSWNNGNDPGTQLPMYKWTHVGLAHHEGRFNVYYNGGLAASSKLYAPTENTGNLWVSNPWYQTAGCTIADLKHVNGFLTSAQVRKFKSRYKYKTVKPKMVLIKKSNFQPKRNTPVARKTLKVTGRYSWMWWVRSEGMHNGWSNMFHKGNTNSRRNPAIFQYPGRTDLAIVSGHIKNYNFHIRSPSMPLHKWTHVAVTHKHGQFRVYWNGKLWHNSWQYQPTTNSDWLYMSDPWYASSHCTVSDMRYYGRITSPSEVKSAYKGVKFVKHRKRRTFVISAGNFRPLRNKAVANSAQIRKAGMYTFTFWIKPLSTRHTWASIIHKGRTNWHRSPAIWFYPHTTYLLFCSADRGSPAGAYWRSKGPLNIYKWTHVAMTHRAGRFAAYVDGTAQVNTWRYRPSEWNGPLFAGDPWYPPAAAVMSDLRHIDDFSTKAQINAIRAKKRFQKISTQLFVVRRSQFVPRYNMVVAQNKQIRHSGKYTYMFWINPSSTQGNWGSVIHKGGHNGERNPAIWTYPSSTRLHIRSGVSNSWNHGCDPGHHLNMNQWYHVAVSHARYSLTVHYNGKIVCRNNPGRPPRMNEGPLYAGDPWYPAVKGRLADLRYYSDIRSTKQINTVFNVNAGKFDVVTFCRNCKYNRYPKSSGYGAPRAVKFGRLCFLTGLIRGTSKKMFRVPNACKPKGPARHIMFNVYRNGRATRADMYNSDGVVRLAIHSNADHVSLDGLVIDPVTPDASNLMRYYGWQHYGHGWRSSGITRYGGLCVASGLIRSGKWGYTAKTVGCQPGGGRIIFAANNHAHQTRMDVLTNGWIVRSGGTTHHGWVNLDGMVWSRYPGTKMSLYSPFKAYDTSGRWRQPSFRRFGKICVLTGLVGNKAIKWPSKVAILPKECRPKKTIIGHSFADGARSFRIDISPKGQVTYVAGRGIKKVRTYQYCADSYIRRYKKRHRRRRLVKFRQRYYTKWDKKVKFSRMIRWYRYKRKHIVGKWKYVWYWYNKKSCHRVRIGGSFKTRCYWRSHKKRKRYLRHTYKHTWTWAYKRKWYWRWQGGWRYRWAQYWQGYWIYTHHKQKICRRYATRTIWNRQNWMPLDGIYFPVV